MMKVELGKNLKFIALFFVMAGLIAVTSCGDNDKEPSEPDPTETIMQIVENTDGFDSLEKYLKFYPDLVATLSGTGDFTVFAPNNTAFIGLLATPGFPEDIRSINPDIVKGVLAYHVSTTRFESTALTSGTTVTTVQGEAITVNANGTLLTGATNTAIEVVTADVKATNGVVHIIGSVMIPPTVGASLTPILGTNAGSILLGSVFTNLAAVITKAEGFAATSDQIPSLIGVLSGAARQTVFAPTNATFAAAAGGEGNVPAFIDGLTAQQCYGIVANHVVLNAAGEQTATGDVTPEKLTTGATFATAAGAQLLIFNNTTAIPAQNGIGIYIDSNGDVDLADQTTYGGFNAEVALPNAASNSNGRIHVIAGLLVPPTAD